LSEVLSMNVCERNLADCGQDVEEVSIGTGVINKYFLCRRCQGILRERLSQDTSMPDWWLQAKANRFVGKPLLEVKDDDFCPGY